MVFGLKSKLFLIVDFANIEGYDEIKNIITRVLDIEDNYNLLLIGPPASSKHQ
jgi:hypothetical protein